jgi:hypothetical protein
MSEKTGKKAGSNAGKTLATSSSKVAKTAAASALTQIRRGVTQPKAAKAAAKVLTDKRFSRAAKSAAASALTQAPSRKSKKK